MKYKPEHQEIVCQNPECRVTFTRTNWHKVGKLKIAHSGRFGMYCTKCVDERSRGVGAWKRTRKKDRMEDI